MTAAGPPAVLLGTPVDDVTLDEAVERIAAMVARTRTAGATFQVATVNVDFVVNAAADPTLLDILRSTAMNLPDGAPVVWGSRLIGTPIRTRAAGADLVPALAELAARDHVRLVLFGAERDVAARAAHVLRSRHPGAQVIGIPAGEVGLDGSMDEAGLARLRDERPDIVCVALGNPKQERWIARHAAAVGPGVFVGVGGSLDLVTGRTRRAPMWIQRVGLEWVFRAAQEPRRLVRRYMHDVVVFLPALLAQAWRGRRRGEAVIPTVVISASTVTTSLRCPAPATAPEPAVVAAVRSGADVVVDTTALERLDNVTRSALAQLERVARAEGRTFEWRDAAPDRR